MLFIGCFFTLHFYFNTEFAELTEIHRENTIFNFTNFKNFILFNEFAFRKTASIFAANILNSVTILSNGVITFFNDIIICLNEMTICFNDVAKCLNGTTTCFNEMIISSIVAITSFNKTIPSLNGAIISFNNIIPFDDIVALLDVNVVKLDVFAT